VLLNKQEGASKRFGQAALDRLKLHSWPGNVRELRNVVQRAYIMAEDEIGPESLRWRTRQPADLLEPLRPRRHVDRGGGRRPLILATLEGSGGDKKQAAETLKISLKTLYNRLNEYKAV
jgi:DNA-binding NtrC family response regulator